MENFNNPILGYGTYYYINHLKKFSPKTKENIFNRDFYNKTNSNFYSSKIKCLEKCLKSMNKIRDIKSKKFESKRVNKNYKFN